jgi:hypothetical protein
MKFSQVDICSRVHRNLMMVSHIEPVSCSVIGRGLSNRAHAIAPGAVIVDQRTPVDTSQCRESFWKFSLSHVALHLPD